MDPITHYMLAYASGKKIKLQKTQLKALTFSALLPDIDVFTIVIGWDFVTKFHGTVTHSIAVAILLSLILSLIFFVYYKKNVVVYALIGISMHFLLDITLTFFPKWRDEGMILLYPLSQYRFAMRNVIPYSLIIGIVIVSSLLFCSYYLLYRYLKQKEYPWRIWIDERRIIEAVKRRKV